MLLQVVTCKGLPAVLSFSFFDLLPAAIVSVLLLFLSHGDDL